MSLEYDNITSYHYSAYRPPLHQLILDELFHTRKNNFEIGLDIGCGTGYSSVALSKFSEQIIGIDPSEAMLSQTTPRSDIQYQHFDGKTLDFQDEMFDVVTFAGSLFYAKSQILLDEVVRVSVDKAQIVVYDFEILLQPVLKALDLEPPMGQHQNYNHAENFSGLDNSQINLLTSKATELSIHVSLENVVHLILSEKKNYQYLSKTLGEKDLATNLKQLLAERYSNDFIQLWVDIYFTIYRVQK